MPSLLTSVFKIDMRHSEMRESVSEEPQAKFLKIYEKSKR